MPGGGAHNVGKGQITDDGELTMSLLHALCEGKGKLKLKEIVRFYAQWIKSKPFDIGRTWRETLFKADAKNPLVDKVKKQAAKSGKSQSNGALMRITPMAVFWHRMSKEDIFTAAKEDASFTHSNDVIFLTNGLYCYAIVMSINGTPVADIYSTICEEIKECKNTDIQEWLEESQKEEMPKINKKEGWVKFAFTLCLRYLKLATKKEELGRHISH